MFSTESRQKNQISRATELINYLRTKLNAPVSVRLWDDSLIPLGENVHPGFEIVLGGPGVIGSMLRRPKADTLLRLYAKGSINFVGADMTTFIEKARVKNSRKKSRHVPLGMIAKFAAAFIFSRGEQTQLEHCFEEDETGLRRQQADNKDFIQFHYDVSNEFYQLFLDKNMLYSLSLIHI